MICTAGFEFEHLNIPCQAHDTKKGITRNGNAFFIKQS